MTGRYHTVCMCLKFQIPFLYITSNTNKIEMLLKDIGLKNSRLLPIDEMLKKNNYENLKSLP